MRPGDDPGGVLRRIRGGTHLGVSGVTGLFAAFVVALTVIGARQVGMKTIWIHSIEDTDQSPQAEPDYIIYHFAELPQAIRFFAAQ